MPMRRTTTVAMALLVLAACTPEGPDEAAPVAAAETPAPATTELAVEVALQPLGRPARVMPLGDSITEGYAGSVTYRWFLWQFLADQGYDVDFVGSQRGAYRGRPRFRDFDQDHEGHWGFHANVAADRVAGWARRAKPDVALVHLGTNDAARSEPARRTGNDLRRVVEGLRAANPRVVVLLAQVIPLEDSEKEVAALNAEVARLAGALTTAESPVLVVDQFGGFDPETGLDVDGIHPTASGELRMALRWYGVLAPVLDELGAGPGPASASRSLAR